MNCRQATHAFLSNSGFLERNRLATRSLLPGDASLDHPVFGFVNEWPGDDEHLPSNVSRYVSILGFSGFWAIFDQWKWCCNHKLIKCRWLIVKLHYGARELSENSYIWILGLIDWGFWWFKYNYCEYALESLLGIVRVEYCTSVVVFACKMEETGQRNAKRGY